MYRKILFLNTLIAMMIMAAGCGSSNSSSNSGSSFGPSYQYFKESYTPHNKLLSPENNAVQIVQYMDSDKLADILDEFIEDGDKDKFAIIITSIPREKAGDVLDNMKKPETISVLNVEYSKDLLYYVNERTYHKILARL